MGDVTGEGRGKVDIGKQSVALPLLYREGKVCGGCLAGGGGVVEEQ